MGDTVTVKVKVDPSELRTAEAEIRRIFGHLDKGVTGRGVITTEGSVPGSVLTRIISSGGGSSGLPGVLGGIPGIGGLPVPAAIAAVAAGLAALPFLAQAAAGGITLALGGGLAALGAVGAFGTGKTVSPAMITAAQDALRAAQLRQAAAQDNLNKLMDSGKASASQLASAQAAVASSAGSVINAQTKLNQLLNNQQSPQQLAMRKAFANLSNDAQNSLAQIGLSFVPVMQSIATTADSVLGKMTPVFAAAVSTIAGPVKLIADTLLKSLASPPVVAMVKELGVAFGDMLKAFTPAIPGIVTSIADGFTNIFRAVDKNPKAFADMAVALFHLVGVGLDVIAWLTQVADYLELHFIPAWQHTRVFLEQWGHDIEHNLDDVRQWIWNDYVLKIVAFFTNTLPHAFDVVRAYWISWGHDIEHGFDTTRQQIYDDFILKIVGFFTNTLPTAFKDFWNWLSGVFIPGIVNTFKNSAIAWFNIGKAILQGIKNGALSLWNDVTSFFSNLGSTILHGVEHILGIHSPSTAFYSVGVNVMKGLLNGLKSESGHVLGWMENLATSALGKIIPALGGGTGLGGNANANMVVMQGIANSIFGWGGGDMWNALFNVEMAEAGFNLTARNPSSGAYGMAQFINGPSEYYAYGGDPYTAKGQSIGMLNYIAQRYGNPINAWAHEQAFHWYDNGGWLPPGLSVAVNKTGRPERVIGPGGITVVLQVGGSGNSGFDAFMLKWLRNNIRVLGGGDPVAAFGG